MGWYEGVDCNRVTFPPLQSKTNGWGRQIAMFWSSHLLYLYIFVMQKSNNLSVRETTCLSLHFRGFQQGFYFNWDMTLHTITFGIVVVVLSCCCLFALKLHGKRDFIAQSSIMVGLLVWSCPVSFFGLCISSCVLFYFLLPVFVRFHPHISPVSPAPHVFLCLFPCPLVSSVFPLRSPWLKVCPHICIAFGVTVTMTGSLYIRLNDRIKGFCVYVCTWTRVRAAIFTWMHLVAFVNT